MEQLHCPDFFKENFLNLERKTKFCDAYWRAMSKCSTLAEAIERFGLGKVAFRCSIVVRREKKRRWPEVESIIGKSRYASGLYWEYMLRLHERGEFTNVALEDVRGNMCLVH